MAKAKSVKEEQLITLTKEQFQKLIKTHSLLDSVSDALNDIDGGEGNLYEIGKAVGEAYSTLVDAYNDLGDLIDEKQESIFDLYEDEDED